jgi:hypothetical protein
LRELTLNAESVEIRLRLLKKIVCDLSMV